MYPSLAAYGAMRSMDSSHIEDEEQVPLHEYFRGTSPIPSTSRGPLRKRAIPRRVYDDKISHKRYQKHLDYTQDDSNLSGLSYLSGLDSMHEELEDLHFAGDQEKLLEFYRIRYEQDHENAMKFDQFMSDIKEVMSIYFPDFAHHQVYSPRRLAKMLDVRLRTIYNRLKSMDMELDALSGSEFRTQIERHKEKIEDLMNGYEDQLDAADKFNQELQHELAAAEAEIESLKLRVNLHDLGLLDSSNEEETSLRNKASTNALQAQLANEQMKNEELKAELANVRSKFAQSELNFAAELVQISEKTELYKVLRAMFVNVFDQNFKRVRPEEAAAACNDVVSHWLQVVKEVVDRRNGEAQEVLSQVQQTEKFLASINARLLDLKKREQDAYVEIERLTKEVKINEEEANTLHARSTNERARVASLEEEGNKLQQILFKREQRVQGLDARVAQMVEDEKARRASLQQRENQLVRLREQEGRMQQMNAQMLENENAQAARLKVEENKVIRLSAQVQRLHQVNADVAQMIESETARAGSLEEEENRLKQLLCEKEQRIQRMKDRLAQMDNEINEMESEAMARAGRAAELDRSQADIFAPMAVSSPIRRSFSPSRTSFPTNRNLMDSQNLGYGSPERQRTLNRTVNISPVAALNRTVNISPAAALNRTVNISPAAALNRTVNISPAAALNRTVNISPRLNTTFNRPSATVLPQQQARAAATPRSSPAIAAANVTFNKSPTSAANATFNKSPTFAANATFNKTRTSLQSDRTSLMSDDFPDLVFDSSLSSYGDPFEGMSISRMSSLSGTPNRGVASPGWSPNPGTFSPGIFDGRFVTDNTLDWDTAPTSPSGLPEGVVRRSLPLVSAANLTQDL